MTEEGQGTSWGKAPKYPLVNRGYLKRKEWKSKELLKRKEVQKCGTATKRINPTWEGEGNSTSCRGGGDKTTVMPELARNRVKIPGKKKKEKVKKGVFEKEFSKESSAKGLKIQQKKRSTRLPKKKETIIRHVRQDNFWGGVNGKKGQQRNFGKKRESFKTKKMWAWILDKKTWK